MYRIYYFLVLLLLVSCNEDDDLARATFPDWNPGFPAMASGAVSVDFLVEIDRAGRINYVISETPLDLSPYQVRQQASDPTNPSIKFNGSDNLAAFASDTITVSGLKQNTTYYAYLVAQNSIDTVTQENVSSFSFKTAYRQDTSTFQSTAEARDVSYLIYRPERALKYPQEKYPILFFLAGNGEVATIPKPINLIKSGTLSEYIYKGNDVPMIVMSIQHIITTWNLDMIDEGVEHALSEYPVDTRKVYMTGLSGGGYACWMYSEQHADKLTAIAPVSGGGSPANACNLKDVAIWAFHNQTDNIVNASNSIDMIEAVEDCSPTKEVKLLLFPDAGHDCWARVYDQDHASWSKSPDVERFNLYNWLLSKVKV